MKSYKIIVADDHAIVREGLITLIEKDTSCKVVAEASDGNELLKKLEFISCDLILLDLSMPHKDGLTALTEIKQKFPHIRVLVLTMYCDKKHFTIAMQNGASGYFLKNDSYKLLRTAIHNMMEGKEFISPAPSEFVMDNYNNSFKGDVLACIDILTNAEKHILKLIVSENTNKEIAEILKISVRTVETHRAHVLEKLSIKNTAGLVKYALLKGII